MAYYSFEKGKYGGACGMIFPFFRTLSGLNALGEDYLNYIPAGYLKCRGQILSANDYPNLARILGVGNSCIYRKAGSLLLDPNPDGTGGTFQLPDLGSKYITGSGTSGLYLNTTTVNPTTNAEIDRAGIEVEISAQGSGVDFPYEGEFRLPGRAVGLTGQMVPVSPPSSTETAFVSIGQTLAHGHNTTFKVSRRIVYRQDFMNGAIWRRRNYLCGFQGRAGCDANGEAGMAHKGVALTESGSVAGTTHRHFGTFPVKTAEFKAANTADVLIPAGPLSTRVNINTANTVKMDNVAPKFILCEYLIKF
jgi:hypothetical protein